MIEPAFIPAELTQLIDEGRPHESLALFLETIKGKSLANLSAPELGVFDIICQRGLQQLLENRTLWMVNHPQLIRKMLALLTEALDAGYYPAATLDHIAWLRCLLAITEAKEGRIEGVHKELCLVQPQTETSSLPEPNGAFQQKIKNIKQAQKSSLDYLEEFFAAYVEFLRRAGRYEMGNFLEKRLRRILELLAQDEQRPGVVQALFYDEDSKKGYIRLIHAGLDSCDPAQTKIVYVRSWLDQLNPMVEDAARVAYQIVDTFLHNNGYPDGLKARIVRWEITTLRGEPLDVATTYHGGSLALPLACAIISAYLRVPVSSDTAFTGAMSAVSDNTGEVLAVDGIPEKLQVAFDAGCRRIFIPAGSVLAFNNSPALQHAAEAAKARVVPLEHIEQACAELFPADGSGTIRDLLSDTLREIRQVFVSSAASRKQSQSHRVHLLVSIAFVAALFVFEGFKHYLAYSSDYPLSLGIIRTICAVVTAVLGVLVSYGLITASLYHRKTWAWVASIVLTGIGMGTSILILGPMLPVTTNLSAKADWPVWASLIKDVFVLWLFAWVLLTDTFAVVMGLEHLIDRRQYITASRCLTWDSYLEGRMPVRAVTFPWSWGLLAFFLVGVFLFVLELIYYTSLREGLSTTYWETFLGLSRDMVLIAAAAEAILFYKMALTAIRKALS